MFGEQEVLIPSMLLCSLCDSLNSSQVCCCSHFQYGCLDPLACLVQSSVKKSFWVPRKLRKLSFPSTVDNFRYTFRSPQYSFMCHFRLRSTTSGTHFDPHNTHSCVISVYGRQLPVHISIPTILIHCVI